MRGTALNKRSVPRPSKRFDLLSVQTGCFSRLINTWELEFFLLIQVFLLILIIYDLDLVFYIINATLLHFTSAFWLDKILVDSAKLLFKYVLHSDILLYDHALALLPSRSHPDFQW